MPFTTYHSRKAHKGRNVKALDLNSHEKVLLINTLATVCYLRDYIARAIRSEVKITKVFVIYSKARVP